MSPLACSAPHTLALVSKGARPRYRVACISLIRARATAVCCRHDWTSRQGSCGPIPVFPRIAAGDRGRGEENVGSEKARHEGRACELVHNRVVGIELIFPKQEATALTLPIGILIVGSVYLALLYAPVILYLG
jgi:hypothetical protein